MKCKLQVSPLWKNPAAKGPWYQVLSNPVIPVDSRVFTPAAKCAIARAAIASATAVGTQAGRDPPSAGGTAAGDPRGAEARPAPSTVGVAAVTGPAARSLSPTPTSATPTRYGTGFSSETVPSISATQTNRASASTAVTR